VPAGTHTISVSIIGFQTVQKENVRVCAGGNAYDFGIDNRLSDGPERECKSFDRSDNPG